MSTSPQTRAPAPARPFIAADIGGTYARLALVQPQADGRHAVRHAQRYACAQWPGLAELFADFAAAAGAAAAVDEAVLACAGYLQGDTLVTRNLPWPVSLPALRQRTGLRHVHVMNDFEALALAVPGLPGSRLQPLAADGPAALAEGPLLVLGPGTGLGCAAVLPPEHPGGTPRVVASEAGHALLAASTAREAAVAAVLQARFGVAEVEHAVSGPGLLNLYLAAAQLDGVAPLLHTPEQVSQAALAGGLPQACEAVDLFMGFLGAFAGDMAISFLASGGVVLAGGVLPGLGALRDRGPFAAHFLRQGPMRPFLGRVPVLMVEHGDLAVEGAARWWMARRAAAG